MGVCVCVCLRVRECTCASSQTDCLKDHKTACLTLGEQGRFSVQIKGAWERCCLEAGRQTNWNTGCVCVSHTHPPAAWAQLCFFWPSFNHLLLDFFSTPHLLQNFPHTLIWFFFFFPWRAEGRALEPLPAAFGRRQGTALDELPAGGRVLSEHLRVWSPAQDFNGKNLNKTKFNFLSCVGLSCN